MKKVITLMACAAIMGLGFTSCDDDDEIIPDAIGDAYIKTVKIGEDIKHGLVLYSFANESISSAKVGLPDVNADSVILASFDNSTTIFRSYPSEDADFKSEAPAKGTYSFVTKTENGHILKRTDELKETIIDLADISASTVADNEIHVKFPRIEAADAYIIRLSNNDDEKIFESNYLDNKTEPTDKDFAITNSTSGWISSSVSLSDVKNIKLISIKFESSVAPNPYHIQAISEAVKIVQQ